MLQDCYNVKKAKMNVSTHLMILLEKEQLDITFGKDSARKKSRASSCQCYFVKGRTSNEMGKSFTFSCGATSYTPSSLVSFSESIWGGLVRAGNSLGLLKVAIMSNGLKENA